MNFRYSVLAFALANASMVVAAEEQTRELENMVTTATLSARDSATVPAFTTVITAEDIERSAVTSLADLLRDTVGVHNSNDSLGRDELRIRGLGGDYTLILVNGKRVSSGSAFAKGSDVDYNSIPLNSIDRVEIIRGPMSSVYGADAIGGVLNIITKAPTQEWSGNVSAEYRTIESGEDGQQQRLGASVRGELAPGSRLFVAIEQKQHDAWYEDRADKKANEPPRLEEKTSTNLFVTLSQDLNAEQTLDVDLALNKDDRPLGVYASGPRTREQELERMELALTHTGRWGWGTTTAFVKHEDSEVKDFNSSYAAPQTHNTGEQNLYAKAYANVTAGSNAIVAGMDYRHQEIEDKTTYLKTGKLSIDELAAFIQDEITVADNLFVTLGGRLDNHEIFGSNFSPKAYVVYQFNDALTVKGGVSKAFKAPDGSYLSEEYRVISCGGACDLAGNPDLKAETSINYEAGIELRQDTWEMALSWFNNDIDDLIERQITYDTNNDPVAAEWINVAKANTNGFELTASADVLSNLTLSGNMTYLDTEYEDAAGETFVLTGRPEYEANTTVDWQASDAVSALLSVNYLAGMQYSSWANNGGTWVQEFPVAKSYYRTDLGVVGKVSDTFTLRGGVKNLTDVQLSEIDPSYTLFELGRNYYVSGTYNF